MGASALRFEFSAFRQLGVWVAVAYAKGDLTNALRTAESKLGLWLTAPALWNTLDVDYEPPRVKRLWTMLDNEFRVYLHCIYPCEVPLYHPHPWPSAVRIVSGQYEMSVGYSGESYDQPPPVVTTVVLSAGDEYEMIDPWGWHSVKPHGCTSFSVMVTGPKWANGIHFPKPEKPLNPLDEETKRDLLKTFQHYYK